MALADKVAIFALLLACIVSVALGMPREVPEAAEKGDLKTASSYGFGYGYGYGYPYAYGLYGYGYPYYGYYGAYGYPFYG